MKHTKVYNAKTVNIPKGTLILEGPISPITLAEYEFHDDLTVFRPPVEQHQANWKLPRYRKAELLLPGFRQQLLVM